MMNLDKPIHVEEDIPIPATTNKGIYHAFLPQLTKMKIGDSFFREGESSEDVTGLLRYAKRNSIHLKAFDVECDEGYLTAGVRVYRVTQESLAGRKPEVSDEGMTYWYLPPADPATAYARVMSLSPGETPDSEGWKQIAPADYYRKIRFCPDHVDYWAHDESDVCWTEWKDSPYADGHFNSGCAIIPAEGFIKRVAGGNLVEDFHAHNGAPAVTHWKNSSGSIVLEFLPGRRPPVQENWTQITFAEYQATRDKSKPEEPKTNSKAPAKTGFWRLDNGNCVKAEKSPGKKATPISEAEYNQWLDEDI